MAPQKKPRDDAGPPLKMVGSPPVDPLKEVYFWADYIELRCLVSPDHRVTAGDLSGILRLDPEQAPDGDSEEDEVSQSSDDEDPFIRTQTPATGATQAHAADGGETTDNAEATDNRYRLSLEVFDLLESRWLLYGDAYPFDVSSDAIMLRDPINDIRRTYLFLLLCSLGRYVRQHGQLTKAFERFCAEVLQTAMPGTDVHVFGTANGNDDVYAGTFVDRARELARHLGERLTDAGEAIATSENGDRGLDIVAALASTDNLSSRLVVFAQAATGRKWADKQMSVSSQAWDPILAVTAPAVPACMISHCFRDRAGLWHDATLIKRTWLLDRHRMLVRAEQRLEKGEELGWQSDVSGSVVDSIINWTYSEQ